MTISLSEAPIGVVPIVWNNVDAPDLRPEVDATHVLDEVARLGFAGCQFGRGFPEGVELQELLATRRLRLAEWYHPVAFDAGGPTAEALDRARDALARMRAAGGEVLVLAGDGTPGRDACFGRVSGASPRLTAAGWRNLAELTNRLGAEANGLGCRLAFHPHAATWVETPDEVAQLVDMTDAASVGICLDVGHYTVGGGDPLTGLRALGDRVTHLHLKDVDGSVLRDVRAGKVQSFSQAIRERLFTELGNGVLDVPSIVAELARREYRGWIMVEQDSTWLTPAEASAIGLRVFEFVRGQLTR